MEELSATEHLSIRLSGALYRLAAALKLKTLRDLISAASINVEAPVWLLGNCYCCQSCETEEALASLLDHFQSILWMSYRRGFTPIPAGAAALSSDAGWGCTLRSGQMILAQGLQRHLLGRNWRWPDPGDGATAAGQAGGGIGAAAAGPPPLELSRLLQLFWDTPAERNAFSLHNLCAHGRECGVVPGRWLGPWVMCKALEATARAALQHHPELGLTVAVLADTGGGAPLLAISRFESAFAAADTGDGGAGAMPNKDGEQQQEGGRRDPAHLPAAEGAAPWPARRAATTAADAATPELISLDSCTLALEAPSPAAALAASVGQLRTAGVSGGGGPGRRGLILLVPLVLGLGRLNPRYIPQLEAVLSWPQSIGVVGGRPGSSLYFVGWQAAAPAAPPAQQAAQANGTAAEQHAATRELQRPQEGQREEGAQRQEEHKAEQEQRQDGEQQQQRDASESQQQQQGGSELQQHQHQAAAQQDAWQEVCVAPVAAPQAGLAAPQSCGRAPAAAGPAAGSSSVLYLDPHEVQEAACSDGDWQSFHCETPRSMPLASIDPSLALGFYCGSLEEYRDLCNRLAALEARSGGAPLVCITTAEAAEAAARYDASHATDWEPDDLSSEEGQEEGLGGEEAVTVEFESSGASAEPPTPFCAPPAAQGAAGGGGGGGSPGRAPAAALASPQQQCKQRQDSLLSPRQASRSGWEVI